MNNMLAARQQSFAEAITSEQVPEAALAHFRPTPQGGPPRLDIYRNAYRARLTGALRDNYPVLHRVLGDEAFDALAAAFITARPSRQPSIRWFGAELGDWLQETAAQLPHPALVDLTRMEWALSIAFDAADATPLQVADLLAVAPQDWPALSFQPLPSLHMIAMNWAVEPLWSAISADESATTDAPEALDHHLLVWRRDEQTQWRSVEAFEALLLDACIGGRSFADLCELALTECGDNAAAEVAGYLRVWVEAGLLARLV